MNKTKIKTIIITECAIMITLSLILSLIPIVKLPNGGSITLGSLSPIIIFSIQYKYKWGVLCSFVYGIINLVLSFHIPPTKEISSFIMVIILDYILSAISLGAVSILYSKIKYFSIFIVMGMRYVCFVVSGILIWKDYVPLGIPICRYSLIYNALYMIPEAIITYIVSKIVIKAISRLNYFNLY